METKIMENQSKSVLDGITVSDKAFPLGHHPVSQSVMGTEALEVVGTCPYCGAPIYGKKVVPSDQNPIVKYSCVCWRRQGVINQNMETK